MPCLHEKRILVTGASGFIGSHICEALLKEGANVIGVDYLLRQNYNNMATFKNHPHFRFCKVNICDKLRMEQLCKNVDMISHQAALCIRYCQAYPQEAVQTNVYGTINVLNAAVKNNVKKVVAASSASVYGDPNKLPIKESDPLLAKNLYGLTKIMNEESYNYYAREFGLPFVAFRYMNVYGTRANPDAFYTSVISAFIKKIKANEAPQISGDGNQSMDFVNVADVVQANILALKSNEKINDFFNVGTGTETSINTLCDTILKLMKSDLKPIHLPANSIDVNRRRADISKISEILGYKPKVSLEEGLKKVIEEVKNERKA